MAAGYVIRGAEQGFDRLQILSRSRWPYTSQLLETVGLAPGMRCLDVGCGSGAVTIEIGRLVAPTGQVVGLDLDAVKIRLAAENATAAGLTNVEFRVQDIGEWDDPTTYDIVYSRFLLQHLPDPVRLLARMWAAVRPGGTLVVEDADFDGWFSHPPNEAFDFFVRTYSEVLARRAGDPTFGRKLLAGFAAAGIPDPQVELSASLQTGEARVLPQLTLEMTSQAIVDEHIATADEVADMLAELAKYVSDPGSLIGGPRVFQVWSQRPAQDER